MLISVFRTLLFSLIATSFASAITITGQISGTCGFFQGSPSNIVYSQTFTGDGTFCTGFMPGGSFTNTGVLQVGDVFALTHNTISASAPASYGVFADFNTTYQVEQRYVVTPPSASPTSTGFVKTFLAGIGTTDDGSGLGSCSEHASVNIAGFSVPTGSQISIPITFGQPITAIETATVQCHDYGPIGHGFGDDGVQEVYAGIPFLTYDANGNFLGAASLSTVPEPSTFAVFALIGIALSSLGLSKFAK